MKHGTSEAEACAAFTRIELIVAVITLTLLFGVLLPAMVRFRNNAGLEACRGNLKLIGLAFRIWPPDSSDNYPMDRSVSDGGSMEVANDAWRTFILMTNELSTPKVLVCPADQRPLASSWASLSNTNISYFICLEARETSPELPLAGDRHLTNGLSTSNRVLTLSSNTPAGWTHELHNRAGNVVLSDGSVPGRNRREAEGAALQGHITEALRRRYESDTNATLRLAMPE